MTYYEVATVKKYERKGQKKSTQINLGVNSKFKKDTKVIVIAEDEFDKLINNSEVDLKKELDDMKAKFEETNSHDKEISELKDLLLKEKEEKEKLLIVINEHEKSINDKELLIASKDTAIAIHEKDIETKENTIADYEKDITNYKKDIQTKDDIIETLTHNWKWYHRIFNKLPGGINLNNTNDE